MINTRVFADPKIDGVQIPWIVHNFQGKVKRVIRMKNMLAEPIPDDLQDTRTILGHDLSFGPSVFCAEETPHMRGYLDSPLNILCSANSCSRFVQGPVFCPRHNDFCTHRHLILFFHVSNLFGVYCLLHSIF